jgi:hypothetical protein
VADIHKSRFALCVAVRPEIGLARKLKKADDDKHTPFVLLLDYSPPRRTHSLAVAGGDKLKTGNKLSSREVNVVDRIIVF